MKYGGYLKRTRARETMKKYKYTETFTFEGKRYYVRANGKRELHEKVLLKKQELEEGVSRIYSPSITVREWGENCEEQYKSDLAISTIENRRTRNEKWIYGYIGSMKVKDVRQIHVQNIMNDMQGMSTDLISKVYQSISFIFEKALENDLIRKNPCKGVMKPRGTRKTHREITPLERKYIEQVADTDERFVFFLFMLYCGCRPGEVANLKGCDIRKKNGANFLHINGTKTENAVREVPIPKYLMERIPKTEPFEYIFKNKNGDRRSKESIHKLWKAFKREMNIAMGCEVYRNEIVNDLVAPDLVPYCLRHTYCTDLFRNGVDEKIAQTLMGHASITITRDIYTHVSEDMLYETALKLRNLGQNVAPYVAPQAEAVGNTSKVIALSRR